MSIRHDRIFALVMVVLFFGTSFGFSFFIIYELYATRNSNTANNSTANTIPTNTTATTANTTSSSTSSKLAGFTPVSSVSSLQSTDLKVGTGPAVTSSENVTINYSGAVAATGVIFQSSTITDQPLSDFIQGWVKGIPGMKVGGERQLLIPASLAYGASPPAGSGIPANAALVFNVTLEKIN